MPPRPKRQLGGVVRVADADFQWHIHREPQWCTADGWKGLSLAVVPVKNAQRQLLIEYPYNRRTGSQAQTDRPKVSPKEVALRISQALQAGWEPQSRGKPFAFQITP